MTSKLLTERQVMVILRRKSTRSIARLRETGELAYLPGKPPMIPEAEVARYILANLVREDRPPHLSAQQLSDLDMKKRVASIAAGYRVNVEASLARGVVLIEKIPKNPR
jgi:hypothetical protein